MRRRDLFKRLGVLAAAVAVAPAAGTAEATERGPAAISDEEMARRRAIWERGRCSYTPDCPCGDDAPPWSRDPETVKAVLWAKSDDEVNAIVDGAREAWCTQHPDPITGAGHWHPVVVPDPSSDDVQRIIAILNGEPYSIPVYEA